MLGLYNTYFVSVSVTTTTTRKLKLVSVRWTKLKPVMFFCLSVGCDVARKSS